MNNAIGENDQCECGDYRKDHVDGVGPCKYNNPNDLTHGMEDCVAFRLAGQCDE